MQRAARVTAIVFLVVLAVTAFVPTSSRAIDLVTRLPLEGARLQTNAPLLRTLLEPLFGPLQLLASSSDVALASFVAWIVLAVFGVRLVRWWSRGELRRRWLGELALLFGLAPIAAFAPLPPIWLSWLPKDPWSRILPTAVALAAYVWYMTRLHRRARAHGHPRRRRVWIGGTARFVGVLGLVASAVVLPTFFLPGMESTARRLVAPAGFVLADLHAHGQTREVGEDALMDLPHRLALFQRQGVAISAVTEHNDFAGSQRGLGVVLLPGEEFTTHALHLTLLGVRRRFDPHDYRSGEDKSKPPDYGYDYRRLIADVHREGGFVVVAHYETVRQFDRLDWRRLVDFGVDGFEIASEETTWARRELIDQWKAAGMLLVAGSDFHGWRQSLHCWNVVDAKLLELDPYEIVRRLFTDRSLRVVVEQTHDERVPVWLEPPVDVAMYLVDLGLGGRVAWAVVGVALWLLAARRATNRHDRRRPKSSGPGGPIGPRDSRDAGERSDSAGPRDLAEPAAQPASAAAIRASHSLAAPESAGGGAQVATSDGTGAT
jgi:predicted metal-dependent phosphoesterase TrpH